MGRALNCRSRDWVIYASPEVLQGGPSTAGHRLFESSIKNNQVRTSPALHLRTSRSKPSGRSASNLGKLRFWMETQIAQLPYALQQGFRFFYHEI